MNYYLVNIDTGHLVGCNLIAASFIREWIKGGVEGDREIFAEMARRGFSRRNTRIIAECYENGTPTILAAQLNLTWKCNLKCKHCYVGNNMLLAPPLAFDEWVCIIQELKNLNVPRIAFLGGEPILFKYFFDLSQVARDQGFKILTSTNGTQIDRQTARSIKQAGYTEVDVSLDGGLPSTHEALRGYGTFRKTLQGIRFLLEESLSVKTATVLHKSNFREVLEIAKIAEQMGVEHCFFNNLVPGGHGADLWRSERLDTAELEEVKRVVFRWNQLHEQPRLFMELHFDYKILDRKLLTVPSSYAGCKAGRREILIRPDGYVAPCPLFLTNPVVLKSNVRDMSILDIWSKDSAILQFRRANDEANLKGKCSNCGFKSLCKGGCHAAAYHDSHDLCNPDPRCPQ
ncbi:MAG: radical SAM protein [Acidobacteria bacterium]|nr:radical SAM protein [Acidobacteriota bacterium]